MPFTQEKLYNLKKCWGCSERCELGYIEQNATNSLGASTKIFLPTIGGVKFTQHLDENGILRQCDKRTAEDAIIQARKISRLCDNYKEKTK